MSTWQFLSRYLREPGSVGAIAPSSHALARAVCRAGRIDTADAIVEFGPGTGPVTGEILKRKKPTSKFFGIERSPQLAEICRRTHPGATIYTDDAANVRALCDRNHIDRVDSIISGLPWASLPTQVQDSILDAAMTVLKPGGTLVTFGYHAGLLMPAGRRFHKRLPQFFDHIELFDTVWANIPPARIYRFTSAR